MGKRGEKDSFESIRRSIKISYLVASVIPVAILAYFTTKYIYPEAYSEHTEHIETILLLTLFLSLLGIFILTRAINTSIASLQSLYLKINSLIETTKQFRETLYPDILLENIVKSAMRLNSAEACTLLLKDDTGDFKFKVALGGIAEKTKDRVVKKGEGITGGVANTGKPVFINNVANDKRYKSDFDKESGFKTKSIMCVPLIYTNEVIGVIEVLNNKNGVFTTEDEKMLFSLADQAAISIVESRLRESQQSNIIHITELLVNIQDYHSPDKKGHTRRVARYANLIGKNMGLPQAGLKNIYHSSLLHDIGFLKIDINEQWDKEKYMLHPQLGYEMVKPISLWKNIAEIILQHHERYDGNGYPLARKGEKIPLGARILAVASTFDVLTSKYSYKNPLDYNAAIQEIEANAGTQFDPMVVKAFTTSIKDTDLFSE